MNAWEKIRWSVLRTGVGAIAGFIICLIITEALSVPLVLIGIVSSYTYQSDVAPAMMLGFPAGVVIWGFRTKPKRAAVISCTVSAAIAICISTPIAVLNINRVPTALLHFLGYIVLCTSISTITASITGYLTALAYHRFGASLNPPPPMSKPRGEHRYGETRSPFEL